MRSGPALRTFEPRAFRLLARVALGAFAAVLAGCGTDFLPVSLLADARVLGVEAAPLDPGPGEDVSLRPLLFLPPGEQLASVGWSFCPFSLGPSAGYVCAVSACERSWSADPVSGQAFTSAGETAANPTALVQACLDELQAGARPPPGIPAELPEVVEVTFRLRIEAASGLMRDSVFRLPQYTRPPPEPRNQPPRVDRVTIGGQPVPAALPPVVPGAGLDLSFAVDPASLDTFIDSAGTTRREEPVWSFYATGGRFDADRQAGEEVGVTWKAEELGADQAEVMLFAVVRDQRGGLGTWGPLTVPIAR